MIRRPGRRRSLQVLLAAYWIALLVLTHWPRLPTYAAPPMTDKLVHFVVFAVLAALALAATSQTATPGRHATLRWGLILLGYATIDELLQPLTGRSCSLGDWLANVAGLAVVLGWFALRPASHPDRAG
ncbi:MAG: VanZ family protein [Phycisphaerae bacterium]